MYYVSVLITPLVYTAGQALMGTNVLLHTHQGHRHKRIILAQKYIDFSTYVHV